MRAGERIDQLRGDAHATARFAHRAFEGVADAQFAFEAAVGSLIVGCLYLPNGNPAPGPKFDYKLHLFERLTGYSQSLLDSGAPAPISRGNRKFESISLQR
jgi:exonuclease III